MEELKVSLENIIPLTYARDHFSQIVSEVQRDKLYVLTKGGIPAVAIIDVKYLETITGGGIKKQQIQDEIKKAPEQVGLPKMVEHGQEIRDEKPASPAGGFEMSEKPAQPAPAAIPPPPPPQPAGFAAPTPPKPEPSSPPKPSPPPPSSSLKMPPQTTSAPKPDFPKPESPPQPASSTNNPSSSPASSAQGPPPSPAPPSSSPPPNSSPTAPGEAKINVQFQPDEIDIKKNEKQAKGDLDQGKELSPDDQPPPAQYSGESKEKVEDMAID